MADSKESLNPSAVLEKLLSLLPPASEKLVSPQDGIVALLHTVLSVLSFRLVAVDEASPALEDSRNVLPDEWNKNGPDHYTLRYKHDQSSSEFLLKVSKLGSRTLVNAIAVETEKAYSLDIATEDFVPRSFYPLDLSGADASSLVHGFISSSRVVDFISQVQLKIIQPLLSGLRREGHTKIAGEKIIPGDTGSSHPRDIAASPHAPQIPGYDPDEEVPYRLPPRDPSSTGSPLEIGRRDREPLSSNPFAPPALFPPNSGDGMIVGPDHPMFRPEGSAGTGTGGPWGGDGFLPPMGAPPGARFDPVAPGIVGPGGRLGSRSGGNAPRFGGDPDNDEFMPPGMDNNIF